jgi:carbonic anhydrase
MKSNTTLKVWVRAGVVALAISGLITVGTNVGATGPVAQDAAARSSEFSYSGGTGPGYWGELDPAWEDCEVNARQSPINIEQSTTDPNLGPLVLNLHGTKVNLINNGHTIEQEYEPGSTLMFEGVVYELLQFHFHTLSEHAIEGKRGEMELHAVFRNPESGNLAVIGQIYKLGKENEFLKAFDQMLPRHEGEHSTSEMEINVDEAFKDGPGYFTYPGSLTTPPCSPIVNWIVLKKRATMSEEQLNRFVSILGNNFRPVQPLNGRTVRASR